MEPTIQMSILYLLVILATSRRTMAMPGIIGQRKDSDGGSAGGKEHSHHSHHRRHQTAPATTEMEELHHELHRVTRELAQTKQTLESLREEMSEKLNTYNSQSPTNMEMSCRTTFTLWHDTVGKTLEYLDNFDVHCRQNEFLRQWRMTWGERGKKKAMKFVCCKYVSKTNSETRWAEH